MDTVALPLFAGMIAGSILTISDIPMLSRAFQTRDLRSYSLTQLALLNVGNLLYWFYVQSLPVGPIWYLHTFDTLVAATMLALYMRHRWKWSPKPSGDTHTSGA